MLGRIHGGFRRSTRSHRVAANLEVLSAISGPSVVDQLNRYSLAVSGDRLRRNGPVPLGGHRAERCVTDTERAHAAWRRAKDAEDSGGVADTGVNHPQRQRHQALW